METKLKKTSWFINPVYIDICYTYEFNIFLKFSALNFLITLKTLWSIIPVHIFIVASTTYIHIWQRFERCFFYRIFNFHLLVSKQLFLPWFVELFSSMDPTTRLNHCNGLRWNYWKISLKSIKIDKCCTMPIMGIIRPIGGLCAHWLVNILLEELSGWFRRIFIVRPSLKLKPEISRCLNLFATDRSTFCNIATQG